MALILPSFVFSALGVQTQSTVATKAVAVKFTLSGTFGRLWPMMPHLFIQNLG